MAYNHFSYVPSSVTDDRSGFKFKKAISKGVQLGWLYPMCKPILMLPGSSLTLDVAMEIRSQPLIAPLMDELNIDLFAFNVPNRIVWEHWKQFLGAVDDVLFDNLTEYTIPKFKYGLQTLEYVDDGNGGYTYGLKQGLKSGQANYQWNQFLACHFELPYPLEAPSTPPIDSDYVEISALPFRGYNFIYNEFFVPEYLPFRILFSKTDNGYSGDNMMAVVDDSTTGTIGPKQWNHFTGVFTPVATVGPGSNVVSLGGAVCPVFRTHRSLWTSCLPKPSLETLNLLGTVNNAPVGTYDSVPGTLSSDATFGVPTGTVTLANTFVPGKSTGGIMGDVVAKINEAVLTVNNYRETILLQNYYDALNRAGSRYDEILANLFHTRTSMAIISIPELIVHKRFSIYRKDVVATAQTNNGSSNVKALGSQAGYIDTVIRDNFFTKSTTEHGYIHTLMCIRPSFIRMTSGFEPDWLVINKLDLFYPQFQGMGDVPRLKMEVAYGFNSSSDDKTAILGYQEYSAEYKYQRNSAVGWLDPHTPNPIRGYNLYDEFSHTSDVNLGPNYLCCFTEEVSFANCLSIVDPTVAPQFICDIRLMGTIYHPMKVYNIPGQADLL